jgi:transcriptional regulator with XRE-family HTH domain
MSARRKNTFVSNLKKVRLERGISLHQAERETGYSYSHIYKTEAGYSNQNNSKHKSYDSRTDLFYEVMAKYYGVDVDYIKPNKEGKQNV